MRLPYRFRGDLTVVGYSLFFLAGLAPLLLVNRWLLDNAMSDLSLRNNGVHTTAVALSTRYEWRSDETTSWKEHTTRVSYTVGGEKYVGEVSGSYPAGGQVDVVYDRGDPTSLAHSPSEPGIARVVMGFTFLALGIGLLGAFILFFVGWWPFRA
ncbi:hypothetical protein Ga0074812_103394 [Parafrankia irregularis]|uniref:DUF3592 domain-containing protein n=1 Tax=Parafrankia irregularis TaxID=795642 RepID=A0A0S4QJC4_9ACTN|nr:MULTISPECIES: DUF3592 domain-containing protein [Parafrankia]MBE3200712.1 hypothetical protein [Parafrankia sp. CH37]CUU54904.1 hypothetical protein Ga0074812_103394 [Parafrankia irregularis]